MVFLCSCGGLIWDNRIHVCGHLRCSCGAIKFNGRGHCCGYTPDYSVPPTNWELYSGYRSFDEWMGSTTWGKRSPCLFNTKNQETGILNSASAMEDIKNIKQTGSFQDYCVSFDILLTKVILSEDYATSLFVEGLKPDIMNWVKFLKPKTLEEAYEKAKKQANLLAIIESFSESKKNRDQILNSSEIQFDEVENRAEIQEVCDNNVPEKFVDAVIDTDVISENRNDNKAAPKMFDEMSEGFGNEIREPIDGVDTKEMQSGYVHINFHHKESYGDKQHENNTLIQDMSVESERVDEDISNKKSVLVLLPDVVDTTYNEQVEIKSKIVGRGVHSHLWLDPLVILDGYVRMLGSTQESNLWKANKPCNWTDTGWNQLKAAENVNKALQLVLSVCRSNVTAMDQEGIELISKIWWTVYAQLDGLGYGMSCGQIIVQELDKLKNLNMGRKTSNSSSIDKLLQRNCVILCGQIGDKNTESYIGSAYEDNLVGLDTVRSLHTRPTNSYSKDHTNIEDLVIIKLISSGAYGQVFVAGKWTVGEMFAIKVLEKAGIIQKHVVRSIMIELVLAFGNGTKGINAGNVDLQLTNNFATTVGTIEVPFVDVSNEVDFSKEGVEQQIASCANLGAKYQKLHRGSIPIENVGITVQKLILKEMVFLEHPMDTHGRTTKATCVEEAVSFIEVQQFSQFHFDTFD